uniref:Chromo domain-containing protein n=1 Tax=Tanacetum cinerariifolium TaxID=118510 RepID=A0A699QDF7_TANCI|nr:hypothetical protein [Tanacetum cinerariifolium]
MYVREATTIHDYTPGSNPTASIDASLAEHQRILEQRNSGNKKEVLIQWKNQEVSDATWEDLQEITIQFPEFVRHEDESAVEREEIDTSHPATQAQPSTAQQDPRPKRVIRKPNRFLD